MILAAVLSRVQVTSDRLRLWRAIRDPEDDAVVACAKERGADYIHSRDRELLGEYEGGHQDHYATTVCGHP